MITLEPRVSPFAGCRTLAELRTHLEALNRLDHLVRQALALVPAREVTR